MGELDCQPKFFPCTLFAAILVGPGSWYPCTGWSCRLVGSKSFCQELGGWWELLKILELLIFAVCCLWPSPSPCVWFCAGFSWINFFHMDTNFLLSGLWLFVFSSFFAKILQYFNTTSQICVFQVAKCLLLYLCTHKTSIFTNIALYMYDYKQIGVICMLECVSRHVDFMRV